MVEEYNKSTFLSDDPLGLCHQFNNNKDIEIVGLLMATLAWGNRKSIINSGNKLIKLMENEPYYFVQHFNDISYNKIQEFKHRTFNHFDLHFFLERLKYLYKKYSSLERIFAPAFKTSTNAYEPIIAFRNIFLGEYLDVRTKKHIADPSRGSAAKRLNMYLRWMVRKDHNLIDLGIWNKIPTSKLSCPLDVHSGNTARKFKLLKRAQNDWKAVEELDKNLRKLDPNDPVRYDFALFGYGVKTKIKSH